MSALYKKQIVSCLLNAESNFYQFLLNTESISVQRYDLIGYLTNILKIFFIREIAEVFAGEVTDGDGCSLFDGDDDTDIALNAFDTAFYTSKLALGNLHSLAGLTGEIEVVEPHHLVALFGGDADKIVHHPVCNIEDFRMFGIIGFQH